MNVSCFQNKEMLWDPNRIFPPVRTCVFSHSMTGVTFLGDPNTGSGLPRGTIVYANQSLPQQVSTIYINISSTNTSKG